MYEYLKSLLRAEGPIAYQSKKKEILQNIYPNKRYSFGEKNKNKKFYVIKRNYNFNGLFSNLIFVIDHIKYAKQRDMIPVVDMENFVTVYNGYDVYLLLLTYVPLLLALLKLRRLA